MVEQHFGLKTRPFRAKATGSDVFVGPQIAVTMASIKKALTQNDAVTTVSGPVGCGKTTIVGRALDSCGKNTVIVQLGRLRLDNSDILGLLLEKLETEDRPVGTIQRFTAFRRQLKTLEENGTRVFIMVEDGPYLGNEALAELEALTAADAGESEGASVVIMGDESLDASLRTPQLVRLQQRIRQRYTVPALNAAELRGYLRHCFRLAGGDFERIFESNAAALLHHLSDGIPRIANNLVTSALSAGAAQDITRISSALLARVAENEFGRSATGFDLDANPAATPVNSAPAASTVAAAPEAQSEPLPAPVQEAPANPPELVVEDAAAVVQPPAMVEPPAAEPEPEIEIEIEIPELIQDTLPDLEILTPEFAGADTEPAFASEPSPEPVSTEEPLAVAESPGDDVPDWERDPTMAELMPDLDALELAMASSVSDEPEPPTLPVDTSQPKQAAPVSEEIPEITLDMAISQRIESNLIDEPGEISPTKPATATDTDLPSLKLPPKQSKKADAEIEKIAAELSRAKSLEDVDDKMAETLFGDEINFVAAHVLANPPTEGSANDDLLQLETVAQGEPVAKGSSEADVEVTLGSSGLSPDGGLDLSASQRLRTVRALNAEIHAPRNTPAAPVNVQPIAPQTRTPEPIEDQINTSLTQTLKALNIPPPMLPADDDDDDERKRGFFSRFKRS